MTYYWEAYKYLLVMLVLAVLIMVGSYLSYWYRRKKVAKYIGVEDIPFYSDMNLHSCPSFLCDFWLINQAIQIEEGCLVSAWLIAWFGQGKIRIIDGTGKISLEDNIESESFADGFTERELFEMFCSASQGNALQASDVTAWINQNDKYVHDWLYRLYREGERKAIDLGYVTSIQRMHMKSFQLTDEGKKRLRRFASVLLYIKDYAASTVIESVEEMYLLFAHLAFLQVKEEYRNIFLQGCFDDNEAMAFRDKMNTIEHFGRAVGGYLAAERALQLKRPAGELLLSSDLRKGFAESVDSKLFFADTTESLLQRTMSS